MKLTKPILGIALAATLAGCTSHYKPIEFKPVTLPCQEERTKQDEINNVYVNLVPMGGADIYYGDYSHWINVSIEEGRNDALCHNAVLRFCGLQYDLHLEGINKSIKLVDGIKLNSLDQAAICELDGVYPDCKPLLRTIGNTLIKAHELAQEITINYFNDKRDPALELELMKIYEQIRLQEGL